MAWNDDCGGGALATLFRAERPSLILGLMRFVVRSPTCVRPALGMLWPPARQMLFHLAKPDNPHGRLPHLEADVFQAALGGDAEDELGAGSGGVAQESRC